MEASILPLKLSRNQHKSVSKIELLGWDSEFFGYPVGVVNVSGSAHDGVLEYIQNEMVGFKLIYVYSDVEFNGDPAIDKKTFLRKKCGVTKVACSISEFDVNKHCYTSLLNLALESGVYSRFKQDANFVNGEFVKLYTKWIEKSINNSKNEKIFVFNVDDVIAGFASVQYPADRQSKIGLLAVNQQYRGRGIGHALLQCCERYAQDSGAEYLNVVTQGYNALAMELYLKNGFDVDYTRYVYHVWRKFDG